MYFLKGRVTKKEIERQREKASLHGFIPQMATGSGLGQAGARILECCLGLPVGWPRPTHMVCSQVHKQRSGWEVEQLGLH